VSRRGHTTIVAPSFSSVSKTEDDALGGTCTAIGHDIAAAKVLAAIAALPHDAIASDGRFFGVHGARPAASTNNKCSNSVKMCLALCEPPTLAVSSFTQMPPVAENPSASDSSSLRVSGVRKKPVPATRDTASSADVMIAMR
jgi:hypothetical protein